MRLRIGLFSLAAVIFALPAWRTLTALELQQSGSSTLHFDAATIKLSPSGRPGGGCHGIDTPGTTNVALGRCTWGHVSIETLILHAFTFTADKSTVGSEPWGANLQARLRVMGEDEWFSDLPGWARDTYLQVTAEVSNPEQTTQNQLRQMLQTLIVESLKLKFHMQLREVGGYYLVVGRNGLKLKPASGPPPAPDVIAKKRADGLKPFPFQQGTFGDLVTLMMGTAGKVPVIDKTNMEGKFDFSVLDGVDSHVDNPGLTASNAGEPIFSVLEERTGLKLEAHKVPVEIFAVDHIEKPSE